MPTRRAGRPRSDRAHRAILEATRDLVGETGYDSLTIDAIATRAGVGRQTVYRWWPNKAAVVAEAVTAGFVTAEVMPPPDTGDIATDLHTWWSERTRLQSDPHFAAMVRGLAAAAAENTADAERLYTVLTGPQREALTRRLAGAAAQGQLRADVDLGTAAEAIIGHLLYRLLTDTTQHADNSLIDLLLHGIITR